MKCPVTVADWKHLYNTLIPHKNSKSKADFWSPSGLKSQKDKYSKYQKMYQHRRQNRWNEPFEIHDTLPIVLKEMVGSDRNLGEMKINMKFTKAVLDLLELDIRMLLSYAACFGSHALMVVHNGRSWDRQIRMQSSVLTFSLPAPSSSTLTNWPRQRIMLS